jgi:hypothetical protein
MGADKGRRAMELRDELLRLSQEEDGIELYIRDATGQDVACKLITINARIGGRLCFTGMTDKNLGIKLVTPAKPPTPEQRLAEILEMLCGLMAEPGFPLPLHEKFKEFFSAAPDVRDNAALHALATGKITLEELRARGFDAYSLVEGAVEEYEFYRLPEQVQKYAIQEKMVLPVYRRASEAREIIGAQTPA